MIREVLQDIGGIGIFGILSLLLFVTTFLVAVVWALRMKRSHVAHMKRLPLEDGTRPCGQGDA